MTFVHAPYLPDVAATRPAFLDVAMALPPLSAWLMRTVDDPLGGGTAAAAITTVRSADGALAAARRSFAGFGVLTTIGLIGSIRTVGRSPAASSRRLRLPIRTDIPGSQTIGFHGAIRIHFVCPARRMATPFFESRSMIDTRPSTRRISKWAREIP
jgi:hypothetical protein